MPVLAKRTVYKFSKEGAYDSKKAQVYGEALQRISENNRGKIDVHMVLRDAKQKSSALHEVFEWNDGIAGNLWRKQQAKSLLNVIVIVEQESGLESKAFSKVVLPANEEGSERTYISTNEIKKNPELKGQLLEQAGEYLEWFSKKYGHLDELRPIILAIESTLLDPRLQQKDGIPKKEFDKFLHRGPISEGGTGEG